LRLRVSLRGDKDYSVNLETKNNDGGSSDVMKTGRVCVCVCVCVCGRHCAADLPRAVFRFVLHLLCLSLATPPD